MIPEQPDADGIRSADHAIGYRETGLVDFGSDTVEEIGREGWPRRLILTALTALTAARNRPTSEINDPITARYGADE